jgi:hypothetical protein
MCDCPLMDRLPEITRDFTPYILEHPGPCMPLSIMFALYYEQRFSGPAVFRQIMTSCKTSKGGTSVTNATLAIQKYWPRSERFRRAGEHFICHSASKITREVSDAMELFMDSACTSFLVGVEKHAIFVYRCRHEYFHIHEPHHIIVHPDKLRELLLCGMFETTTHIWCLS